MKINLISGTLDTNDNLDGWVISSKQAIAEGAEYLELARGDKININGDVWRGDEFIGNIA